MSEEASVPPRRKPPERIGLALSGGGFRATLFHLGVIQHLSERGYLAKTTHVCSVSGGSILAAHMVLNWQKYKQGQDYSSDDLGSPNKLIDFATVDARNLVFRRAYSVFRLLRWKSWSPTRLLQAYYGQYLFGDKPLSDLRKDPQVPDRPELHLLTTELETGQLCSFSGEGFHKAIDKTYSRDEVLSIADQPIALAVAASSAIPTVFHPVRITPRTTATRRRDLGRDALVLTDGGVYDNLGITPFVAHLKQWNCDTVFVSDASRLSDWISLAGRWTARSYLKGLRRSYDVAADRLYIRDRQSLSDDSFVHLPITDATVHSDIISREHRGHLQSVPTDLDALPLPVVRALVVHGQLVAGEVLTAKGL